LVSSPTLAVRGLRLRRIRAPRWRLDGLSTNQLRYPDCSPRLLC